VRAEETISRTRKMRNNLSVVLFVAAMAISGCGREEPQEEPQSPTKAKEKKRVVRTGEVKGENKAQESETVTSVAGVITVTKNFLDNLLEKVQSTEREQQLRQLKDEKAIKRHQKAEGTIQYRQQARIQLDEQEE
jgi:hypothetical protein